VNTEQQLIYWGELLKRAEDQYEFLPDAYWREIAPYKHMLRVIRLRAGIPICWGAADCLEKADIKCSAGKHETCGDHSGTCLLCKGEATKGKTAI
jgi:hypothetical protein